MMIEFLKKIQIALSLVQTSGVAQMEESRTLLSWPDQSILLHWSVERFLGDWIMWCELNFQISQLIHTHTHTHTHIYVIILAIIDYLKLWNHCSRKLQTENKIVYCGSNYNPKERDTERKKDKQANDFSACASSADTRRAAHCSSPCFVMSHIAPCQAAEITSSEQMIYRGLYQKGPFCFWRRNIFFPEYAIQTPL